MCEPCPAKLQKITDALMFSMLRGSFLGSSMNSQVFRSSNDLKMRRFFFSERKNVQFFQSMKWLELIESEVLLASGDVLASVSFRKKGPSHLGSSENFTSKPQYLETYIDVLWIENRVARQPVSFQEAWSFIPLSQCAPEGDTNFPRHNVVPDEQVFICAEVLIRSVFQHLLMQKRKPDW